MDVLFFVLLIIAHFLVIFGLVYCSDDPGLKENDSIRFNVPSLSDLENASDIAAVDEYVKDVITPTHNYSDLLSYINHSPNDDGCLFELVNIVLQFGSLKHIVHYIQLLFFEKIAYKLSSFWYGVLPWIIAFVSCFLIFFIMQYLYNRFARIRDFDYTVETLKTSFALETRKHKYEIEESCAFNNYGLLKHHSYLSSIKRRVERRRSVRKVLTWIGGVIYFLFFFNTGSYN